MLLLGLRKAAADRIGTWFPGADAGTAAGRMTEAEIKRMAVRTPAIRVAVLGLPSGEDAGNGEVDRMVAFTAYVLTTDKPKLPRDDAALAMVENLMLRLPGQRWDSPDAYPVRAHAVTAENLYSATLGNVGVTLWAVVWRQQVRMGENAYPQGPALSAELYTGEGDEPGGTP